MGDVAGVVLAWLNSNEAKKRRGLLNFRLGQAPVEGNVASA
jgi:hypothetical protein